MNEADRLVLLWMQTLEHSMGVRLNEPNFRRVLEHKLPGVKTGNAGTNLPRSYSSSEKTWFENEIAFQKRDYVFGDCAASHYYNLHLRFWNNPRMGCVLLEFLENSLWEGGRGATTREGREVTYWGTGCVCA